MPPLEMPSTSPVRPTRNVTVPRKSNRLSSERPVISWRTSHAHRQPRSANGTLNQNTQCQEIATSAPPSTGPITRPTAATIVFVPIASAELLTRERVGDDRGGVREQERTADALEDPPQDELRPVPGEPGAERREREHQEAADVGVLAAELVRQPARAQHEHGRGDHVDEDHPDELEQARVEAALEVGQGDDQRPRVDRRQQHPQARAGQSPPLVVVVLVVDADAAALSVRSLRGGRLGRGQQIPLGRKLKLT